MRHLLGLVTCGIYPIYWFYKLADRQKDTGKAKYNVDIRESGNTILLWMVVGLVVGFGSLVGMYFVIVNMNTLAAAYNASLDNSGTVTNGPQM